MDWLQVFKSEEGFNIVICQSISISLKHFLVKLTKTKEGGDGVKGETCQDGFKASATRTSDSWSRRFAKLRVLLGGSSSVRRIANVNDQLHNNLEVAEVDESLTGDNLSFGDVYLRYFIV